MSEGQQKAIQPFSIERQSGENDFKSMRLEYGGYELKTLMLRHTNLPSLGTKFRVPKKLMM
jgi:hypothetical protein